MKLDACPGITAQPFLKWAGGKGQLIPRYRSLWPRQFKVYHEPFVGGAAVFFALAPPRAVLSDANPALMDCYRIVRDRCPALMDALRELRDAHDEAFYYHTRERFNRGGLDPVEAAALFIYLNRTCYNGLYRVNSRGHFNVPHGRYKRPAVLMEDRLLAASRQLQTADLRVGDFDEVVARAGAGDFVYFDPPYQPVSQTACFTSYTEGAFHSEEQARLADVFRRLDAKGCYVMLSNSSSAVVRKLYRGFRIGRVLAPRAINCRGDGRGEVTELVIRNYPS